MSFMNTDVEKAIGDLDQRLMMVEAKVRLGEQKEQKKWAESAARSEARFNRFIGGLWGAIIALSIVLIVLLAKKTGI